MFGLKYTPVQATAGLRLSIGSPAYGPRSGSCASIRCHYTSLIVQVEVAAERKSLRSAGRSRALQGGTVQGYFLRLGGVRSETIWIILLFSFLTTPTLTRPAAAWSFSASSKAGQL